VVAIFCDCKMSEPRARTPVVHVHKMGGLGNHMIQIMTAMSIAMQVKGCVVSGEGIAEWGLSFPEIPPDGARTVIADQPFIDVPETVFQMNAGAVDRIEILTFAQHINHFLDYQFYNSMFVSGEHGVQGFGSDVLLINIRGDEILDARHPDYVLLPIPFYRDIIKETGLKPVFMGQLGRNEYTDELRRAFPHAEFHDSGGAMHDFEVIRRSKNIIPSISTFSWLAAWLSEADTIILPVTGLLNPIQSRPTHLLPLNDTRYRFYLFPAHYAVPVAEFWASHAALQGLWRAMPGPILQQLLAAAPRFPRRLEAYLGLFDEAFYRIRHPDIGEAIETGDLPDGLWHYRLAGHDEFREPFALDKIFYTRTYPLAAVEIGQGDYTDPWHHYVEVGRFRGYLPVPPQR
jgi:hypothetical protein